MRIVVHDKRYKHCIKPRYTLDINLDYKLIPDNIPLTQNVLKQYQDVKNPVIGYAHFRGLTIEDIKSILSAVKRNEAHLNVDRMGITYVYKLHKI